VSLDQIWVDLAVDEAWAGFTFRLHFGQNGDLAGLDVRRSGQAAELTATLLQRVPLGALERSARRHIRDTFGPFVEMLGSDSDARRLMVDAGRDRPKNAQVRAVKFARLAVWYVETLDRFDQMDILAKEFDWEVGTVPKMIGIARNEYHFLTPTIKGRSGGSVTTEAYRVLTSNIQEQKWATLSETQRGEILAQNAANRQKADRAHEQYQRGEITHAELELTAYGQNFPRDQAGNVVLNFDEGAENA
jgi:hypothetical protein